MSGIYRFLFPVLLLSSSILLSSCGSGTGAQVRLMNASPDEGQINFLVGDRTVASSLGYTSVSNYESVSTGSQDVQIEPVGSSTVALTQTLNLAQGSKTTVLAENFSANLVIASYTDDTTAPDSGKAKLRLIHAAPSLGTVDVFVVAPGTDLNTVTAAVPALAFENASAYLSLAAGTYEVLYVIPGSTFVLFDAGSFTLAAGQNRTVVSLNGSTGGFSTLTLSDLN